MNQTDRKRNTTGRYASSTPASERVLSGLFLLAELTPRLLVIAAPTLSRLAWWGSASIRSNILDNLARLLPTQTGLAERRRVGVGVLKHFILFVADMGAGQGKSVDELTARIASAVGEANHEHARSLGRGLIIVTAHMGSFEVGMAAMVSRAKALHVVFAEDPFPRFEKMRRRLREKLGVNEARVEEGWSMWASLRDALERDEAVVVQGDRLMPGQKGAFVELCGERVKLPSGPVRLAMMTGAPILPIYSLRQKDGRIRIVIGEPIVIDQDSGIQQPMQQLSDVLSEQLRAHPEQWLMLHRIWQGGSEESAEL